MMFSNKRAFEMSVGMIVIIIISVLIFSMSLYFVFKWFASAEQLKAEIDRQTQEQIIGALKTGNQLVAIPIAVQQAKRGTITNFGIGIRNIAQEKPFSIAISFSDAYKPDGTQIEYERQYVNDHWLGAFATTNIGNIKKNEQKVIPFLIKADLNVAPNRPATAGDYIFNVCVYDTMLDVNGQPPSLCDIGQYQVNSQAFYTGKIYQVTVKIV